MDPIQSQGFYSPRTRDYNDLLDIQHQLEVNLAFHSTNALRVVKQLISNRDSQDHLKALDLGQLNRIRNGLISHKPNDRQYALDELQEVIHELQRQKSEASSASLSSRS